MPGSAKASGLMSRHLAELRNLTGLDLVLGTLNIRLERPIRLRETIPWKGWGSPAYMCPVSLLGHRAFAYRYSDMPPDRIEILSDTHFRSMHQLRDRDEVVVLIENRFLDELDAQTWVTWAIHRILLSPLPTRWRAFGLKVQRRLRSR